MTHIDSKKELCRIGRRMMESGLVVACDGNLSYRRDDGAIVITPSGVPKGELVPQDLLRMDLEGHILKGEGKASSETSLHLEIYKARPDVKAIVHCHPVTATAVSVAGQSFPSNVVTEGRDFLGPVTTVPFAEPGSLDLAVKCAQALKQVNVILMASHGACAVGDSLAQAFYRMETLESVAKIYRNAMVLNASYKIIKEESQLQNLASVFTL